YPQLPCLQVGPENRKAYLPLEVCDIAAGQKCTKKLTDTQTSRLIRESALSAPDRENEIGNLVRNANFSTDPYAQEFDVSVTNTMMELTGRVLPAPELLCGGSTQQRVEPRKGVWDMRGKKFYEPAVLDTWALACFAPREICREDTLRGFIQALRAIAIDAGMSMNVQPCMCDYFKEINQVEPVFRDLKSTFPGLQLLVVVLPGKTPIYAEVKRVGNTVLGVATQCVYFRNVTTLDEQILSNLCLKINAKLGGINCIVKPKMRPPVFKEPAIFLGASVTHPQNGDKNFSIAAVVGSLDAHPHRYAATVRVQQRRQEIIQDLASMVKELLRQFYKWTRFKPVRIVMYRGAVSEGQLEELVSREVRAIREACLRMETDYKPGITFVIVQRQHHTRLFCSHEEKRIGRSGNVPPGTTVDTDITHPTEFDFYLCSHAGIQVSFAIGCFLSLWTRAFRPLPNSD
ncbi:hypothetical protein MTO96_000292, partial [Rhipicephalus appendiculatus]